MEIRHRSYFENNIGVEYYGNKKMETNEFNFTLFFSCASLFSLISWYDNLQVPTNLGCRVDARCHKIHFKTFNLNDSNDNPRSNNSDQIIIECFQMTNSIQSEYIQIECFRMTNFIQSGRIQIECFWVRCLYSMAVNSFTPILVRAGTKSYLSSRYVSRRVDFLRRN